MQLLKFLCKIWAITFPIYLYLNIPKKINHEIKEDIMKDGITHITHKDNIELMVDEQGYSHFKSSSRLQSYSNFFRKSVFFFIGEPNMIKYIYNISLDKQERVLIKVLPENINESVLSHLKWRKFDKTIIHTGDIRIKAEVCELRIKKLNDIN